MTRLAFVVFLCLIGLCACTGEDATPTSEPFRWLPTPQPPNEHLYSAQEAKAIVVNYLYDQAECSSARGRVTTATSRYTVGDAGYHDLVWAVGDFLLYEKSGSIIPRNSGGEVLLRAIAYCGN